MLEVITLIVAAGAFLTAVGNLTETWRQRRNAVRPVLVVVEKRTDNRGKDSDYSLYLVNMGQAVAINIDVKESNLSEVLGDGPVKDSRTEIAVGRRGVLATGYREPALPKMELTVEYTDVNNARYTSSLRDGKHVFREQGWMGDESHRS